MSETAQFPIVPARQVPGAPPGTVTNLSPEDYERFMAGQAPAPATAAPPQTGAIQPAPVPGDDNVKKDFMAGRAVAQAGDPLKAMLDRVDTQKPAAEPKPVVGATPGQANAPPLIPGYGPANDDPVGKKLVGAAAATTAAASPEEQEEDIGSGLDLSSAVAPAGSAIKDIAKGAIETPQAVLRGILGGTEQTLRGIHTVGDAIDNALPQWLGMGFPGRARIGQGLDNVADMAAEDKSEIPEPSTTTGGLMEGLSQFGTGLLGGQKAAAAIGLAGTGAKLFADVWAGAQSMDPNAPRMSNLIDSVAPNFITDWLKAKPGQEEPLMGRLKSGLEFAGLGVLFEGLKAGLGTIKQSATSGFGKESNLGSPNKIGTAESWATGNPPREGPMPEGIDPNEAPPQPVVEITPRTQGQAETVLEQQAGMERMPPDQPGAPVQGENPQAMTGEATLSQSEIDDYIAGRTSDNPIRINLLRIGSGDDIRAALEQVARTIPEPEVVSHDATIRAADSLGLSPQDFLAGYQGTSLNAAETTAMRFIMDSAAAQVVKYAKIALDPLTNTEQAKADFVRAFATANALQRYFVGARAEAGRTLNAWNIMSRQMAGQTKAFQQLIEQAGDKNISQIAADVASLDDPLLVSRLIAASQKGTGRDTFMKVFYNVLLSNPRTVVKKLASDGTMAMWNLATTFAAEKMGSGAVQPGETAALGYGYLSSLKDAIRVAGKGLKAGESQFFQQFQTMDWQDNSRLSAMANGAPEMIPDDMPQQAGASYLRAALPTSWIGAADDFAKYLNYRAYVRAGAFREGMAQGLRDGDLATHVSQSMDNVPDSLHQQALAETLRSTFQEPLTGAAKMVENMIDSPEPGILNLPIAHTNFQIPVGRMILPFIKTPTNIARWSYRNSALALAFPTAGFKAELGAGGATRDLAMARVWLGSAVALGFADVALNNVITGAGPRDPQLHQAWRNAGNEPYSVQIPGTRPVGYNMSEPLGMMMGGIADTFNIMKFAREDGRQNLAASLMFGVGHAMLSKTYMQSVANVFDALDDPERDGDRVAQSLAMTFLSPQGLAAIAHATDPFIRAHRTLLENEESRLPIVSQGLPPARTIWGIPVPQKDAYLPFMSPDGVVPKMLSPWQLGPKPEDVQPIDSWIWDNRSSFPRAESNQLGISKPGPFQNFEVSPGHKSISVQVQLDPEQYDRFLQLSGNETKNPSNGMGALDTLNGLVTGTYPDRDAQTKWNDSSAAVKALQVQTIVRAYRKAAQVQMRQEFPDVEAIIQQGAQSRAQQLQGP